MGLLSDGMKGNPRIAPTAYYTAQVWVEGGYPNAEHFDTNLGRLMYHGLRLGKSPIARFLPENVREWETFIDARHRTIDREVEKFGADVIVEIGAGLSGRGLTVSAANPDLAYYEFDLPHMVEAKRSRLPRDLPGNYHLQAGDILAAGGMPVAPEPGARLLVITEGLIPYLDFEEKQRAWRNVLALMEQAGASRYLLDDWPMELIASGVLGGIATRALGLLVGARMDQRLFDTRIHCKGALRDAGFSRIEEVAPALPGAAYGACPWRIYAASA